MSSMKPTQLKSKPLSKLEAITSSGKQELQKLFHGITAAVQMKRPYKKLSTPSLGKKKSSHSSLFQAEDFHDPDYNSQQFVEDYFCQYKPNTNQTLLQELSNEKEFVTETLQEEVYQNYKLFIDLAQECSQFISIELPLFNKSMNEMKNSIKQCLQLEWNVNIISSSSSSSSSITKEQGEELFFNFQQEFEMAMQNNQFDQFANLFSQFRSQCLLQYPYLVEKNSTVLQQLILKCTQWCQTWLQQQPLVSLCKRKQIIDCVSIVENSDSAMTLFFTCQTNYLQSQVKTRVNDNGNVMDQTAMACQMSLQLMMECYHQFLYCFDRDDRMALLWEWIQHTCQWFLQEIVITQIISITQHSLVLTCHCIRIVLESFTKCNYFDTNWMELVVTYMEETLQPVITTCIHANCQLMQQQFTDFLLEDSFLSATKSHSLTNQNINITSSCYQVCEQLQFLMEDCSISSYDIWQQILGIHCIQSIELFVTNTCELLLAEFWNDTQLLSALVNCHALVLYTIPHMIHFFQLSHSILQRYEQMEKKLCTVFAMHRSQTIFKEKIVTLILPCEMIISTEWIKVFDYLFTLLHKVKQCFHSHSIAKKMIITLVEQLLVHWNQYSSHHNIHLLHVNSLLHCCEESGITSPKIVQEFSTLFAKEEEEEEEQMEQLWEDFLQTNHATCQSIFYQLKTNILLNE